MMLPSHAADAASQQRPGNWVSRFVFSRDHKVIGIQYWLLALLAVGVGLCLSILMRVQLAFPDADLSFLQGLFPTGVIGGVLSPEFYLSLVTMHGTLMVFFVLTTAPTGGFGNYFLPLQIGARGMAFPKLGALSFWLTFLGLVVLLAAFFVEGGAPLGGWTAYPPLSALGEIAAPGQGAGMNLWIVSIALFCMGALLNAVNMVVTTLTLRAPGVSLMRMPLTCWSWFTTSVLTLLSFPVLLAAGVLLLLDRNAATSFFLPTNLVVAGQLLDHRGGSPILWQHLFWYFGHPEVYIAILPAMGVTSQVLATFARKPVFGYRAMVFSTFAIGLLGFLVWGHHMFTSGMSPYAAIAFSLVTLAVGIPSALKTVNWIGTLWGGRIRFTTAMLFAVGFVSLFVSGGLGGIFLGQTSVDLFLHDTYFVVGHFHLVMGAAAIFGIFAATYYWFPRMFGRMLNETLGRLHFFVTFIGIYLMFVPMHALGLVGAPRRYYDSSSYEFLGSILHWNELISGAAFVTAAAQVLFVVNLLWSGRRGRPATHNPWEATTREWSVPDSSLGSAGPLRNRSTLVGMTVLLVPILMLFLAFASAYVVRQGMGEAWVPVGLPSLLWLTTALLLLSVLPLERACRLPVPSTLWVWLTGLLGALFLGGQWLVWQRMLEQGVDLVTSPHSSFFYVLTVGHGLFVLAGIVGLLLAAPWQRSSQDGSQRRHRLRLASIYWYSVTVLWLGVVLLLKVGG